MNKAQGTAPSGSALKLGAETVEDVVVFSTVLQDAVTIVGDLTYLPHERRFAAMFNRYLWEQDPEAAGGERAEKPRCWRIRSGLHFDSVLKVSTRGLSPRARKKVLELLAIHPEPGPEGSAVITLLFAGGGAIRLEVECIDGYLSDIGAPWPARCRPEHPLASDS